MDFIKNYQPKISFFRIILLLILVFTAKSLLAQDSAKNYKKRPFAFTFIAPVSSNGTDANKIVNNVSLTMIAGYSAGLEGAEFGGFGNVELDYVKGAQFAGFGNVVVNDVRGAQFAGFANYAGGNSRAGQFAGFANTNLGSLNGAQFAGFANYCKGLDGLQAAGFSNVSLGSVKGAQIAGFANVANRVNGAQISGFLNVARKVNGVQIGVFNFADSVDGASIGFFSFVLQGYHKLEAFSTEVLYVNAAFKTGSDKFYNIFTAGIRPAKTPIWSYGYGIGTQFNFGEKSTLNVDLVSNSLHEMGSWSNQLNLLNHLDLTYNYKFSDKFSVFAGPVLNVYVFDPIKTNAEKPLYTAPYVISDNLVSDTKIQSWIGAKAGIRLF
ncbi:MAG: hypothetical protein EOP53_12185 [Sphingobacteriales bacterium]|nr:MAG: hypothetical protein EOP53_12185 [Sphingobacteriales bacterium]